MGVVVIPPSSTRPHVVRVNFSSLREGAIKIRRGSTTTWATSDDLRQMLSGSVTAAERRTSVGDLIQRAADPKFSTASLALEAWQLTSSTEKPEDIEWLRKEIVGYATGKKKSPSYRQCRGYVSQYQINPQALSWHNLDSIAASEPSKLHDITFSLGSSIAELEHMVSGVRRHRILWFKQTIVASGDKPVEGYFYFTPDSVRWVLTQIRDRIIAFLMDLQAEN